MRHSASQYSRSFTTRAETGSDVAVDAPYDNSNHHQAGADLSEFYGSNWRDPELHNTTWSYRDSATPMTLATASNGDYPYPQTLDFSSAQSTQAQISHKPILHPSGNDPDIVAYYTHGGSRPQGSQAPDEHSRVQRNVVRAESQRQRSTPRPPSRSSSSTSPNDSSTRPRYGHSTSSA